MAHKRAIVVGLLATREERRAGQCLGTRPVHREARLHEAAVPVVTGCSARAMARNGGVPSWRLLLGMIRANRPRRVMVRLSLGHGHAGAGTYAVTSSNLWTVSDDLCHRV